MPDRVPLELSAMGAVRPPASAALAAAKRREQQGFDAVWWADHLLHWFPDSIWTPELVPQAAAQASPHVWFDPVPVIAAAAATTRQVRLGIGVTDLVRNHPAALARTALTLDHLTGGRFLLGVGSGEALNLSPFGMANDRPLARLEEGLQVLRLLMSTTEPVDHDGDHFHLREASVGLAPAGEGPPPVWLAAHRPRGLRLVGRTADGWLPLATDPDAYAAMLATVQGAAAGAGRDPDVVTPGLYARVVVAETAEDALAAIDGSLLLRFIALTRPAEAYEAHGIDHPLGPGAFGLTTFQPTALGREEALELARAVPLPVLRDTVIHGTPDDVAATVLRFVERGARHVQITNMTPMADPTRAATSESLLADTVAALRTGAPAAT
ncbi:MAG: LLM class flavin-dependent oxidoreductase [Thermoleophilia bacterium]